MQDNDKLITPVFKVVAELDPKKTKESGRPIYRDKEVVTLRIAGDRNFIPTFGAHDFWKNIDGQAYSYAQRFPEQYRRFKEGLTQTADGTPLEELPFLSQAKRFELKALSIYTAEALASLDGKNLKALGIGGRELKDQATAYLEKASGSADVIRLAAENASMKATMDEMKAEIEALRTGARQASPDVPEEAPSSEFDTWSDEELKGFIADATGSRPRGNPSTETLRRMALEAQSGKAAA